MIQADSQISGVISTADPTPEDIIYSKNGALINSHDESDDQDNKSGEQLIGHKKYGNMKVIHEGNILITLGPDYWCFIPAFICFTAVSVLVASLVHNSSDNLTFKLMTDIVCFGECLSYLLVAISNPGIVVKPADNLPQKQRKKCLKCDMLVPRYTRHCNDCGVCITDYDHHCPWTSKCIGGNNLIQFYTFLIWTPIFMVYITIAFVVCMSQNMINIQQLPK